MERDILADVDHPFIVKLHYGKLGPLQLSYSLDRMLGLAISSSQGFNLSDSRPISDFVQL